MVILRPVLGVSGRDCGTGSLRILSYNVLAQALIRRDQYPTNGKYIRWTKRKSGFENELRAYNPDLIFLQEVDNENHPFWRKLLTDLSYAVHFYGHRSKKHGLAIAWRDKDWSMTASRSHDFDTMVLEGVPRQCNTQNVGLLVRLESRNKDKNKDGVINSGPTLLNLGTTHLYWHPGGSYERSRQLAVFLRDLVAFNDEKPGTMVIGGDLNTEPFDPSYLFASGAPLTVRAHEILVESVKTARFDPAKPVYIPGFTEPPKDEPEPELGEPKNPTLLTDPQEAMEALIAFYSSFPVRGISLYGEAYAAVHPQNLGDAGEPAFTNWTDDFRSTLDYIMLVRQKVDSAPVKVCSLLRLPEAGEMGPEPSSLPRAGRYPSDHLAIMAQVDLS